METEIALAEKRQSEEKACVVWNWLDRRADMQILIVLMLVVFGAFSNSLRNQFVYDDHILIESNYALRDWSYFTRAFAASHSYDVTWMNFDNSQVDYYRPFTRMLFALAYQAFGLNTHYWHLLNIFIFCGVVALAYSIIKQLSASRAVAALGALLFAVHPVHSEAVAWVNCLVETQHALFFLAAFSLYLFALKEEDKRRARIFRLGSMTLMMAAMLTKETALCFPILVGAYHFIIEDKSLIKRITAGIKASLPFLLVVVGYVALRYFAYGGSLRAMSFLPIKTVLLTIPRLIVEYLRMLALPLGLSAVHSVGLVTSLLSLRFWLPLLSLIAGGIFLWKRAPRRLVFVCAWIFVTILPVLNIGVFTLDLMLQDRYAFLPSLGFCAAVAIVAGLAFERSSLASLRPVLITVIAFAVISLTGLTIRQNGFWYSDLTLFARAAEENPNSEHAQCNYASALHSIAQEKQEAALHFSLAYKLANGQSQCGCLGLGNYYADKKDYDQAIQFYERAIDLGVGHTNLNVFNFLAYAYSEKGDSGKAIRLLSDTLSKYPNFQEAHYMMAGVLLKSGHNSEGIEELHRALELNPQDANAHLLLGQAYEEKGLRKEAAEEYKIALNISPNLELARIRLSALEK